MLAEHGYTGLKHLISGSTVERMVQHSANSTPFSYYDRGLMAIIGRSKATDDLTSPLKNGDRLAK